MIEQSFRITQEQIDYLRWENTQLHKLRQIKDDRITELEEEIERLVERNRELLDIIEECDC